MDFTDERPIYLQIADDIRRQILVGSLRPGDQLMSTTQYATQYRINPATANKAFGLLVDSGVAEKRRGIGMFVTTAAPEILRTAGREHYLAETLAPALAEGLMLGFSAEELTALTAHHVSLSTTSPSPSSEEIS